MVEQDSMADDDLQEQRDYERAQRDYERAQRDLQQAPYGYQRDHHGCERGHQNYQQECREHDERHRDPSPQDATEFPTIHGNLVNDSEEPPKSLAACTLNAFFLPSGGQQRQKQGQVEDQQQG